MRYPHIRGTVDAVQRQPTLIPLRTGIGCPDFLRPFEDTPPPSTIVTHKYPYAHSGVAVGFLRSVRNPAAAAHHPFPRFAANQISEYGGSIYGL